MSNYLLESIAQALAEAARSGPVQRSTQPDLSCQVSTDRPARVWMASAGWPFPVPFAYRVADAAEPQSSPSPVSRLRGSGGGGLGMAGSGGARHRPKG